MPVIETIGNGKNPDVIVIGGGVIGLATSYELSRLETRVVNVFARSADAEGASLAAGAMLGAFGEITADDGEPERPELEFRIEAQRRYPDWLAGICDCAGTSVHQNEGTFIVGNNDGLRDHANIHRMKEEADRYQETAVWVAPSDVPGLMPSRSHFPHSCLHLANEHSVDSAELIDALRHCLASFPVYRHVDDSVVGAYQQGKDWVVKLRGGGSLAAHSLVLCAGSRSFDFLSDDIRIAAELPKMFFGKGVSCLVIDAPPIPQTIRTPNRAFACGAHVVPRSGEHLYIGATNCLSVDRNKERGFQPGELHNLFDEVIHQINTDVRCSTIKHIRVGHRPIATTRQPLIGKTPIAGLFVATGTYRNGVLMAPLVSEIVAAEVLGRVSPVRNIFAIGSRENGSGKPDFTAIAQIGIRDIIAFLHEPGGYLPYDRAGELEKYVKILFEMAVSENGRYADLRDEIRQRLREAPLNETMHKLFYDIVGQAN